MTPFQVGSRSIGDGRPCFIIAEIGQNHQGELDVAKQMILKAKECGADCVKFQKSHLDTKFTRAALDRPYSGPNSWGTTYGAHKTHLEFTVAQYVELQSYADQLGILFTASAMDTVSLQQLHDLHVPFIKIGSGDANNIPLLERAAAMADMPLVISTGMQEERMIERIVRILGNGSRRNVVLMHCVSSYPTRPDVVGLRMVERFRAKFPGMCVGYSGHEQGVALSLAAVALGAKVIERHFTLDATQKGTDHMLSLTPDQFAVLTRNIRRMERLPEFNQSALHLTDEQVLSLVRQTYVMSEAEELDVVAALQPQRQRHILPCEMECSDKLGKSLVYASDMSRGHILCAEDVCFKVSYPKGLLDDDFDKILGACLRRDVAFEEPVLWDQLHK